MLHRIVAISLGCLVFTASASGQSPPPAVSEPGDPAPPEIVAQFQSALVDVVQRFEAMDANGVLRNLSDRYRSGPLTKPLVRDQLGAMFSLHDRVWARIRIDDVRVIGDRYWIYSTGDVTGRVRVLGTVVPLLSWNRAPEVAWQEDGHWRLIGDQQP